MSRNSVWERIDQIFTRHEHGKDRASHLCLLLQEHFPMAEHIGAVLAAGDGVDAALIDQDGKERREHLSAFEDAASHLFSNPPPSLEQLPFKGNQSVEARICNGDIARGVVVLWIPKRQSVIDVHHELESLTHYFSLRWRLEDEGKRNVDKEAERLKQEFLADVGEVARPVVHELYNLLNTISLQVDLFKINLPEYYHDDLTVIKRQIVEMASVLKLFRQYRDRSSWKNEALDLNDLALEVVERFRREWGKEVRIETRFEEGLPLVTGSAVDLQRLLRFLLRGAAANSPPGHQLVMSTKCKTGHSFVEIEDVDQSNQSTLGGALEQHSKLEVDTCKMLAERARGKLTFTEHNRKFQASLELPSAVTRATVPA